MEFFSSNMEFLRNRDNLKQSEMQDRLDIDRTTWSNYERGKSFPKLELFHKIAQYFGVSETDLLNTNLSTVHPTQKNEEIKKGDFVHPTVLPTVHPTQKNIVFSLAGEPETNYGSKVIPITDIKVAAGGGIYAPEHVENLDSIGFPSHLLRKDGLHLCVRAKGESMAPSILDSDMIIIRLLERSEWDFISKKTEMVYVVCDGDSKGYLKRVKNRLNKGFITLMSDNLDKANYPNFNLQYEELASIWEVVFAGGFKIPNINAQYFDRLRELENKVDDLAQLETKVNQLVKRLL